MSAIDAACQLILDHKPDAVRAIYLFGSHADGTALDTSDIDIAIITTTPDMAALTARLRSALRASGPHSVDLVALDHAELLERGHFRIERGSKLLRGEDVRARLPPIRLDGFLRHYAEAPLAYIGPVLRDLDPLSARLDYPDPHGEYFGYDRERLPPHGEPVHNVKALVACACWIATLTVALRSGRMVASKSESVQAYASDVNDEWTPLIDRLHTLGRQRWHYRIPAATDDRRALHELCRQFLALERHYINLYADHLLANSSSATTDDREYASQMLRRLSRA